MLTPVLREVLNLTKDEKIPNVQIELTNCLGVVHGSLGKAFLNKDVRDRLERFTIDPEFDTSYFAKKAMKKVFN